MPVHVVEAVVRGGADVTKADDDGATPLYIACEKGDASIVEALLGRDADVNKARTDIGATPLYKACENHHTSCVQLLVRARADLALSCNGKTPFALASSKGFSDIVAIIESGSS
jgi:ankyrin repeat protein